MKSLIYALCFFLVGCGSSKPAPPAHPTGDQQATYDALVSRLPQFYDHGGWVVSRGKNTNQGDSLLFTGLAIYGLPCEASNTPAGALADMLATKAIVRYPGNTDAPSFDSYLGLLVGIWTRVSRCGDPSSRWAAATVGQLPVGFDFVRKKTLAKLGASAEPSAAEEARMELDVASFAAAPVASHSACFRINLALLSLQLAESLGNRTSAAGKAAFCDGTRGARISTVEHYCGRDDLVGYLDNFKPDVWIYQHQRCPGWEFPDAGGDQEPGIDFLVAFMDKQTGA